MIWNTKLGSTKCKPGGKYCKDHTRNRFCTKFASSLYFIVGKFAGQQRINMKYVINNICKTRHCGHYLMEIKTKDDWLSDHANMDQIIKDPPHQRGTQQEPNCWGKAQMKWCCITCKPLHTYQTLPPHIVNHWKPCILGRETATCIKSCLPILTELLAFFKCAISSNKATECLYNVKW